MIVNRSCLNEFAEKLHSLPSSLTRSDLLASPFRLHQENELAIYYSPHNEYINRTASIVIAGITPGFSQRKQHTKQPQKACGAAGLLSKWQ